MEDMENIAYLSDMEGIVRVPSGASVAPGNIPKFGSSGAILDSGISSSDMADGLAAGTAALGRDKIVLNPEYVAAEKPDGTGRVYLASAGDLAKKADMSAIDHEYDTSTHGYAVGDTCAHDGKWYKCKISVAAGQVWSADRWEEINVNDRLSDYARENQADWSQDDPSAASYIKNKPEIPVIDDTLENEGEAADAAAVGERLSAIEDAIGGMSPPAEDSACSYEISELIPVPDEDDTVLAYQTKDRTVNVISANVPYGKTIKLLPPQPVQESSGAYLAREFLVSVSVTSDDDVAMSMTTMSLKNYDGEEAVLSAIAGKRVTYKFIDVDENQTVFLVTMFSDPANVKAREAERALDAILRDEGVSPDTPTYSPGLYIYDETTHRYHKILAVQDPETGEENIGVDQDGIVR